MKLMGLLMSTFRNIAFCILFGLANVINAQDIHNLDSKAKSLLLDFTNNTCKMIDLQGDFYQEICLQYTNLLMQSFETMISRTKNSALIDSLHSIVDDDFPLEQISSHFAEIKNLALLYNGDLMAFDRLTNTLKMEHKGGFAYFENGENHLPLIALAIYGLYKQSHIKKEYFILFEKELQYHKATTDKFEIYQNMFVGISNTLNKEAKIK